MKKMLLSLAVVGLFATAGWSLMGTTANAAAAAPADITYDCPNGDVTFSHEKHIAKHPNCADCHTDPFNMAKSELGMEKGHAGCSKCHKADGEAHDVAAADSCTKCHVAK